MRKHETGSDHPGFASLVMDPTRPGADYRGGIPVASESSRAPEEDLAPEECSMRLTYFLGLGLGLALVIGAQAQQQPAQPSPYPTPLYRMEDVSKALNLDAKQVDRLNRLTEETQGRYRDQYGKLNDLKDADRAA